jgi:hypothetical protein
LSEAKPINDCDPSMGFASLNPSYRCEAIAEARSSLNALCASDEERDQFEIFAVIRKGADLLPHP